VKARSEEEARRTRSAHSRFLVGVERTLAEEGVDRVGHLLMMMKERVKELEL